ncbi:ATP-binding protein [Methanococcoides methylutens]|uniref:ChlI component of cobalt chelatase involved in B12 biosynthesis n=1 Tax=Methanococcoides methylutens MM1 TaxID=1434104 RepID=A0A0E3X270_METMT|nr:ATP-binding protein [Methanococcoides methylutens]AKB85970.1 ChlI component of cobalt chelatase involved in B12 biosynthesis [Methanococcoides methylutens MM1]
MSFTNITGSIKEVPKPKEEKRTSLGDVQRTETRTKRVMYPISGIVGQEMMLRALILNAINPSIGGVLIRGQKGTAKSTAVRGLAEILPEIDIIEGCKYNCDPLDTEKFCWECRDKQKKGMIRIDKSPMKVVDLPVGATEDRVVGSLDIEKAVKEGVQAFEPGILAKANRNLLYVDEINLLDDFVVDALLDAAAMGVNTVEREGVSVSHPANFIIVGSMNPEEGELRPQLLDRIALQVEVEGISDIEQRVEIIERRNRFNKDPQQFRRDFESEQEKLRTRIIKAKQILGRITTTRENLRTIAQICVAFNVDGHRADIMIERTARTNAAYENRERITNEDIIEAAEMVLPHRMRKKPFEEEEFSAEQLRAVVNGTV